MVCRSFFFDQGYGSEGTPNFHSRVKAEKRVAASQKRVATFFGFDPRVKIGGVYLFLAMVNPGVNIGGTPLTEP